MMSKKGGLWPVVVFMCLGHAGLAQGFAETALLFSRTQPGGSARIQSMGGSQVGLGGDYSTALSNPAGLGMFNRSEFTLSPALNFANTTSTLFNQKEKDSKTTFHIPGFSLSFHKDYEKLTGFLGGTFSIAYARANDFNGNLTYGADGLDTSIIDYFLEQANGFPVSQFGAGGRLENTPAHLGYENYLIGDSTVWDPNANPNAYFTDVLGKPNTTEEIQTRGAQNQMGFSYGANYNDRLFLGAGVGVVTIRYKSRKRYTEAFQNEPLNDLFLEENLEIRGSGINANVGVIFRPVDFVQIGLAATSPTYYELSDNYSGLMRTHWNDFDYYGDNSLVLSNEQYSSDLISTDYSLQTPGKVSAGATFFLQKQGFITFDIERANYAKAKYNAITQGVSFDPDNQDIQSLYQPVFNLRAGAEYRWDPFRLRAGYALLPEPFKSTQNGVATSIQRITGGIGYREKNFYIDMAVVHTFMDNSYRPYTVNSTSTPLVTYSQKGTNVILTLGLAF